MFELFVVGYFRFMFVYFWCEQCFFFRNVLLLIEQKVIGVFMFMEIEVFVWIFFCMNIDVYYFNGLI